MAKQIAKKDALQELKTQIRCKMLQRLYFFHGEETFLMNHYLQQMKKQLIDDLTESFNYHKLNAETFDLQALAECVENLPMMSENTLVQVDEIDIFKLAESDRDRLIQILSDIPPYCTVVFRFVTTSWKPDKRLKKLWETIEQYGSIVEFARQDQKDLVPWITRHFAAGNKRISPDLCVYLIDITGGTMTALSSEISKIIAYSGADTIVKRDIDAVTEPVMDAVVFQMTDLLGQGEYGAALLKLRQLLKMQQEPLVILGAIGSHFRRIGVARSLMDSGKGSSELMQLCGLKDYPARKTMATAKNFSAAFCRKSAEKILETDYAIKTSFDDPERLLELLILELSQEARNG